jgi:hypothetical protein
LDAHGFQLGLATLPGRSDEECHDACGSELFDIIQAAQLSIELQPSHYFDRVVPVAELTRPGRSPSIVPDASMPHISLPAVVLRRGGRRGSPQPAQHHLFDVKTIHGGTTHYYSAFARDEQSGAVHAREVRVQSDYERHAREMDTRFHPDGSQQVLRRLQSFSRVRGLVFGAYGEASADVHALLDHAATAQASREWRAAGARSAAEMRQILISRSRRQLGLAAVQAMARHRIARQPYVGRSREVVQRYMQAGADRRRRQHAQVASAGAWAFEAQGIYEAAAQYQARGGLVWAA